MKHFGDITKINGATVPPVNIITGGSPCQDLSVAGKRAGLAGERSGLFMEQIRIIKEMREHDRQEKTRRASAGNSGTNIAIRLRPRYMVWENVPGAFSSNGGEDFRAVLEETAKIAKSDVFIPRPTDGRWTHAGAILGTGDDGTPFSIAWRLHDAQYWGVPQRRKRIALVADFGGWSATKILFDSQSLPGDTEQSGAERERAPRDPKDRPAEAGADPDADGLSFQERAGKPGGGKGILIQRGHVGALSTMQLNKVCAPEKDPHPEAYSTQACGDRAEPSQSFQKEKAFTIPANPMSDRAQAVVYGIGAYNSNAMKSDNPHAGIHETETSRTLDINGGSPACNQGGLAVIDLKHEEPTAYRGECITSKANASNPKPGDPCHTLSTDERNYICIGQKPKEEPIILESNQNHATIRSDGISTTLPASMGMGGGYVPMVTEKEPQAARIFDTRGKSQNTQIAPTISGDGERRVTDYSSLVFTEKESCAWDGTQTSGTITSCNAGGGQRMPDKQNFNAIIENHASEEENRKTYGLDRAAYNQGKNAKFDFSIDEEKIGSMTSRGPGAVGAGVDCRAGTEKPQKIGTLQSSFCKNNVQTNGIIRVQEENIGAGKRSIVRRLTPMECERLQGYPDGWTNIGDWTDSKGKKHKGESDAPRYKALGNSIALPFWEWLAERIISELEADGEEDPTIASLFDGIGGFPLVFSRHGCRPIWASEIEEFPIAVTKIRFPEEQEEQEERR